MRKKRQSGGSLLLISNFKFRISAFTLVELLVVVAVISVLAAILMPSLNRVREHARGVMCMSRLSGIGVACAGYTANNRGIFPPSHDPYDLFDDRLNVGNYPQPGYAYPWHIHLWSYHENFDTYICPASPLQQAAEAKLNPWVAWWITRPAFGNYVYKGGTNPNYLRSGYGYNNFIGGWAFSTPAYTPKKISNVSSKAGLFGDSWLRNLQYDVVAPFGRAFGGAHIISNGSWLSTADARHGGNVHVGFVDGHVAKVPEYDAWWEGPGNGSGTVWRIE